MTDRTWAAAGTAEPGDPGHRLPRVSCIMPTRDRRPFVAQAVGYFLRQDYPDTELVVVDDGNDAVGDLMPDDPRVRYLRLDAVRPLGAKRNLACQHATGELIAHWDDDDWSSPRRLRRQVGALLAAEADACGLSELLHYRAPQADAWLYRGDGGHNGQAGGNGHNGHVAGCSLVYRRAAWSTAPFLEVNSGEDSAFVARLPGHRVVALADRSLMVAVVHGRNTSSLQLGTRQWAPASLEEVAGLLGADRPFYTALRTGRAAPARRAETPAIAVTVAAAFGVGGYETTAEYLALALSRAGAAVRALPLVGSTPLRDEVRALTRKAPAPFAGQPTILHTWLGAHAGEILRSRNLFVSTMWESDRFPRAWVDILRDVRAVIVPSTFVADICRAGGVTRPVHVVPLGADPDVYHWQPRERRAGLVSLIVGPVADRKNTPLAIAAWKEAFAGDPDARLIIKTTYGYHNYAPDDPRISYVDQREPTGGIGHWYQQADVLLALGNEGFGLPLVEGMGTGLPVIALDAEGQADVCRDAGGLVLPVPAAGRVPYPAPDGTPAGHRSVPDLGAVVRHLRWVDGHRDEARDLGRAASAWVAGHRNIWSLGPGLLDVVGSAGWPAGRRAAPPPPGGGGRRH
ncbi:glycosyltransferase, partial [Frankia sp. CNm7]|uniref:glycosyltransferase n=1 Tax=Frankia nepalensis TaxID=1836974 RepID=UPI00193154DF